MSALPSFEPSQRQSQQIVRSAPADIATPTRSTPRRSSRANRHRIFAQRRQGVEVSIKLVTYSLLSLAGVVTLVNILSYNWTQQSKLQDLNIAVQDARIRTAKVNSEFNRSFDPALEKSVMEENSYKVAADRIDIVIAKPAPAKSNP